MNIVTDNFKALAVNILNVCISCLYATHYFQHIMLVIRFIITCAIPDIPGWLAAEMAKIEWARREASRITNSTPSPEEMTAKMIGRFSVSPSHNASHNTENLRKSNEKLKQSDHEPLKEPTPLTTPTTPGTSSSTSSHKGVGGITIDTIQEIPPFRPRKSKEWTAAPEVKPIYFLKHFQFYKASCFN